jgi:hypothetical protein
MDIGKRLAEIWNEEYIASLPNEIISRGYTYADNVQSEILVTGINPSFRNNEDSGIIHGPIKEIWYGQQYDNYWSPIKKMLFDEDIDLRDKSDYLDIFYFKEREQNILKTQILKTPDGIKFIVDQLNLTMHIIEEVVKPKLLVVKNKESQVYFGKLFDEKGWVWMGYEFEHILDMECGELCRIIGLRKCEGRIAPEFKNTQLEGTFVLFTKHINQYTPIAERPTSRILKLILDWYDSERGVREFAIK